MTKKDKWKNIDDIIDAIVSLPDETIDEILGVEETFTADEAVEEVVKIAKEHDEVVRDND